MSTWSISYRVGEGQDRNTRYDEAKQSTAVPPECSGDEASAHTCVEDLIVANGEPAKPYAIYTSGTRSDDGTCTVQVMVQANA